MRSSLFLLAASTACALQVPGSGGGFRGPPRRRGGALAAAPAAGAIAQALAKGSLGVPALAGLSAAVLTPLTMYRQGYSFSVGYGAAVAVMGVALQRSVPAASPAAASAAAATVFYGARLAAHLLVRQLTVPDIAKRIKEFDKQPRLQRLPLVGGVAVFYALMTSPLLFALRAPPRWPAVAAAGAGLAWFGAIVEAAADLQKFVKKRGAMATAAPGTFDGPSGGPLYALCRHPNYFGEVAFWFGLLLAGIPSFGTAPVPIVCGGLGFYGIFSIMTGATKRLDKKQEDKYGGQPTYDAWRAKTGGLFPKLV